MKKKILSLAALIVVLFVGCLTYAPVKAEAAASIYSSCKNQVVMRNPDYGYTSCWIYVDGVSKASQIKNLKSSKSGVKVRVTDDGSIFCYSKKFLGTTKISFTVGKKKLSTNVTFIEYENLMESISIDGDDYTRDFDSHREIYSDETYTKKKLSIKAKSGWIISNVYVYNRTKSVNYDNSKRTFNKTITANKADAYISITIMDTKTYDSIYYTINII